MPNQIYQTNLVELSSCILNQKKKIKSIIFLRVLTFFVFSLLVVFSIYFQAFYVLGFEIIPILLFGVFLRIHSKEKQILSIFESKKRINEEEIACLEGNFKGFEDGKEFYDSKHEYSNDIDLFGPHSLFQYLNRTTSTSSKKKLANLLMNFETDKFEIKSRQEAIQELTSKLEWRQNFRAKGIYHQSNVSVIQEIENWNANEIPIFENKKVWVPLLIILPIFICIAILANVLSLIPFSLLVFIFLIPLAITGKYLKLISSQHAKISKFTETLKQHNSLSFLIEKEEFQSKKLVNIKQALYSKNKIASEEINKLAKLTQQFDNRSNPIFAFIMNTLFLWDLQYLYQLKKWISSNKDNRKKWFESVFEMEVYSSLANFAFNNPENCYPSLSNSSMLNTSKLAHPLLLKSNRVSNEIKISNLQEFVIITGANMAGKSTFLRAIGVNLVLAISGAPICAKSFEFTPTQLFTSMRTSDSLSDNESYFYSELKRLQLIVDKLKTGEKLFIILDEILKGTNSKDKAEGSKKFVSQILKYQAAGIIATHDLSLCSIKNDFPEQVQTHYFDVEIENDQLVFDYKLKPGICSNMNAEFLMKKMGITE